MIIAHRLSHVVLALSLVLALHSACNSQPPVDPMKAAASSYKKMIEPALQKSEEIARTFVQIVLDDKGTPDPDKAAQRIQAEVVPKAQELLEQVKAIEIKEPSMVEMHQSLVQAATLRLEGYQEMAQGYTQKNMDQFSQGQKKVTESKILEDNYIARADQIMRSQGYELVYFSPPAPDALPAIGTAGADQPASAPASPN